MEMRAGLPNERISETPGLVFLVVLVRISVLEGFVVVREFEHPSALAYRVLVLPLLPAIGASFRRLDEEPEEQDNDKNRCYRNVIDHGDAQEAGGRIPACPLLFSLGPGGLRKRLRLPPGRRLRPRTLLPGRRS